MGWSEVGLLETSHADNKQGVTSSAGNKHGVTSNAGKQAQGNKQRR
jgi:hypothetical protein